MQFVEDPGPERFLGVSPNEMEKPVVGVGDIGLHLVCDIVSLAIDPKWVRLFDMVEDFC